jgi:hypothetical protein
MEYIETSISLHLKLIILATQEAKIRRISVGSQQIVTMISSQKRADRMVQGAGPEPSPSTSTAKQNKKNNETNIFQTCFKIIQEGLVNAF